MSKNAYGLPSRVGSVVLCALVLAAAPVARGREDNSKDKDASALARARARPVRIVNETRSPVPVINVDPFGIVTPSMSPPKETIVLSENLAAEGLGGSLSRSLPAVQDWAILEIEALPLPPSDPQFKPAQACTLSVEVPFEEVHPASNLASFLSVSWSGLDFRSFHRQLPIAVKRQAGEFLVLVLTKVAGDGSALDASCRATVILRGVALPAV